MRRSARQTHQRVLAKSNPPKSNQNEAPPGDQSDRRHGSKPPRILYGHQYGNQQKAAAKIAHGKSLGTQGVLLSRYGNLRKVAVVKNQRTGKRQGGHIGSQQPQPQAVRSEEKHRSTGRHPEVHEGAHVVPLVPCHLGQRREVRRQNTDGQVRCSNGEGVRGRRANRAQKRKIKCRNLGGFHHRPVIDGVHSGTHHQGVCAVRPVVKNPSPLDADVRVFHGRKVGFFLALLLQFDEV